MESDIGLLQSIDKILDIIDAQLPFFTSNYVDVTTKSGHSYRIKWNEDKTELSVSENNGWLTKKEWKTVKSVKYQVKFHEENVPEMPQAFTINALVENFLSMGLFDKTIKFLSKSQLQIRLFPVGNFLDRDVFAYLNFA
jgi:hypothetical protein